MGSIDPGPVEHRRILFIDAFDSFTNNIVGLVEQSLGADVTVVHIDDEEVNHNLEHVLDSFDAVVIGPGPGHPANPNDVGLINKLWGLNDAHMLPVFGICLGFQSLCYNHGAEVKKLRRARHGIISRASHRATDIFKGIGDLDATQYHSLHADLGSNQDSDEEFWEPTEECPSLRPLAWDVSDEANGRILMGVRHTTKPFWGVQFHPESICTSKAGKDLVANWWSHAKEWLYRRNRRVVKGWARISNSTGQLSQPDPLDTRASAMHGGSSTSHLAQELRDICGSEDIFLRWGKHPAASINAVKLLESLGCSRDEVVMLDSQGHASGRYSIIGLITPGKTMKVTYKVTDRTLRYGLGPGQMYATQLNSIEEVWPLLQESLDLHDPRTQGAASRASTPGADICLTGMDRFVAGHLPEDSPFWGGFMGYISYEAGLETIDVDLHPSCATGGVPDINFAFIHRSIVIDHETSQVYIQSLLPGDWAWILNAGRTVDGLASQSEIASMLKKATPPSHAPMTPTESKLLEEALNSATVSRPTENNYRSKVLQCQSFLASGDSYELCLTDETEIVVPASKLNGSGAVVNEWALYKRLRQNNPAPFGAFMRLSDVVVVGSSPERFLRWTREGHCQFRPIKGTVKKSPEMTREQAHAILGSSKERAENLMIVDLIRHDLSGVVGAENTWVSKLMVLEEYETVYQLVSVIEGQLPDPDAVRENSSNGSGSTPRGIHVLKASLPPGSMTGAPKKRSCEILGEIEQRPRGVYSGVLGYMDIGGAGDFSVVIRTAVRGTERDFSEDGGAARAAAIGGRPIRMPSSARTETWRVGAGGAVTIQSTDEGEFLEMETKASSVLGALLPRMK